MKSCRNLNVHKIYIYDMILDMITIDKFERQRVTI